MCGRCCHGLRLPVNIAEAAQWLERGGAVQLLCEAMPWLIEPAADDVHARRKRTWSFPATSGDIPVRIIVTLAAQFDGACPHLLPDMRCGGYDLRPSVCRIYPAEISPLIEMTPARKACPPEAWAPSLPLYERDGAAVDAETRALVARSRADFVAETLRRAMLCARLGIATASFSNEGFAIHAPDGALLLETLRSLPDVAEAPDPARRWTFLSNRAATVAMLRDVGALADPSTDARAYVGFFADA